MDLLPEEQHNFPKVEFKKTYGIRPNFQEIIFGPPELKVHPPVLLDLTTDSIILFDAGILREEIAKIKKRLKELGSKKIKLKKRAKRCFNISRLVFD